MVGSIECGQAALIRPGAVVTSLGLINDPSLLRAILLEARSSAIGHGLVIRIDISGPERGAN